MPDPLFTKDSLRDFLSNRLDRAKREADDYPEERLRAEPAEAVVDALVSRFDLEPISVSCDDLTLSSSEGRVDPRHFAEHFFVSRERVAPVLGTIWQIDVPFSRTAELLRYRPSQYSTRVPRGAVVAAPGACNGVIRIDIPVPHGMPDDKVHACIQKARADDVQQLHMYATWQAQQVEDFKRSLRSELPAIVQRRTSQYSRNESIAQAAGIPLKPRGGAPILPIPMKRAIAAPAGSPAPATPAAPTISDSDYDAILSILRHQARTFERAPAAFAQLEEEYLRDLTIAALNAVYEGSATAEAFRRKGKTDICIEAGDRSAFVAECKVWSGPKALAEAVVQLLGYLTWRDSKSALVFYNKTGKEFQKLLATVDAGLPGIDGVTAVTRIEPNEWRAILRHHDGHHVVCRVMVHNLRTL